MPQFFPDYWFYTQPRPPEPAVPHICTSCTALALQPLKMKTGARVRISIQCLQDLVANKSQENIMKEARSCFRTLRQVTGNKNPSQTLQQQLRFGFDKMISGLMETLKTWAKVRYNTKENK